VAGRRYTLKPDSLLTTNEFVEYTKRERTSPAVQRGTQCERSGTCKREFERESLRERVWEREKERERV
jgi:hypothetical protein